MIQTMQSSSKRQKLLRILIATTGVLAIVIVVTMFWLSHHLTSLLETALQKNLGHDVTLGAIETDWKRVVLKDIHIHRNGPGPFPDRLFIRQITLTPSFRALASRKIEIKQLSIEQPRILIEIGPDGKVVTPLPSANKQSTNTKNQRTNPGFSLHIAKIELTDGELLILDRHTNQCTARGISNLKEGYQLLRFPKVYLNGGPFYYPLVNQAMPVNLSLSGPQTGNLTLNGHISLVSLDSSLKLSLRQWDITRFRPYYLKPGDIDVTRGTLDGDANITISKRRLNIPGEARIKGLQLNLVGSRGFFLGLPASTVLAFLKNDKDEITVPFTLAGDLSNPRFKVRQSLVDQIATGVASKIGIPIVSDVARGVIFLGEKGVEGIGKLFGK